MKKQEKQEKIRNRFDKHRQGFLVHAMTLERILREIKTKSDFSDADTRHLLDALRQVNNKMSEKVCQLSALIEPTREFQERDKQWEKAEEENSCITQVAELYSSLMSSRTKDTNAIINEAEDNIQCLHGNAAMDTTNDSASRSSGSDGSIISKGGASAASQSILEEQEPPLESISFDGGSLTSSRRMSEVEGKTEETRDEDEDSVSCSTILTEEIPLSTAKKTKKKKAPVMKPGLEKMLKPSQTRVSILLDSLNSVSTYSGDEQEMHIILVNIDIFSSLALSYVNACIGKLDGGLQRFETVAQLAGQILNTRLELMQHAKAIKIEKIKETFFNANVEPTHSISSLLHALEDTSDTQDDYTVPSIVMAAEKATDDSEFNGKWSDYTALSRREKNMFKKMILLLTVVRVKALISLDFLESIITDAAKKKALEVLRPFIASYFTDLDEREVGELNLIIIHDDCLVLAMNSSDANVKRQAIELSSIFAEQIATNKRLIPMILEAESAPWTVIFSECSQEQRQAYASTNPKPYLTEKKDDKYTCSQQKRRQMSRMDHYSLLLGSIVTSLCNKNTIGKDFASLVPTGLACSTPSDYRNDMRFITNTTLHLGSCDEAYIKSNVLVHLNKIVKTANVSIKEFQKNGCMFINLTNDIENGTRDNLQVFTQYFSLGLSNNTRLADG